MRNCVVVCLFAAATPLLSCSDVAGSRQDKRKPALVAGCGCPNGYKDPKGVHAFIRYQDTFLPVQGSVIDGNVVFEGDMVLGPLWEIRSKLRLIQALGGFDRVNELVQAYNYWVNAKGVVPEISPALAEILGHRDAAEPWPDSKVYYSLEVDDDDFRGMVEKALGQWSDDTGITFVKSDSASRRIRFVLAAADCSWDSKSQLASVRRSCVKHEIGHALGLLHEHTRSDRNSHIKVFPDNILTKRCYAFEPNKIETARCGPYDFSSVMHYGSADFSCNGSPTMKSITGMLLASGNDISAGDKVAVKTIQGSGPCS